MSLKSELSNIYLFLCKPQFTPSATTKQSLHKNYQHKYHHLLIWDKMHQSCLRNTHSSQYHCVHKPDALEKWSQTVCDLTLPSCVQNV